MTVQEICQHKKTFYLEKYKQYYETKISTLNGFTIPSDFIKVLQKTQWEVHFTYQEILLFKSCAYLAVSQVKKKEEGKEFNSHVLCVH
jgi:hypothetical protein